MTSLQTIRGRLEARGILHSEDPLMEAPTAIGYDKRFRWRWIATQLNTFVAATDLGDAPATADTLEAYLGDAFAYARANYTGWPRGLQSGLGVIGVLLSRAPQQDAIDYSVSLASGKKWAGFTIPVVVDTARGEVHRFANKPMWGRIYYPFFEELIDDICAA